MYFFNLTSILFRCFKRDISIFFRSGYDFFFNFIFLYKLKNNLNKIKPQINDTDKHKKKILVDCFPNSLLYVYALLLHTFPIQKKYNSDCLVYCSNFSFTIFYLLSVLKKHKIIYVESFLRNFLTIIKYFKILKIEFYKIQKIQKNHFDYKFEGIELGRLGYDNYLRKQKYGRLKNISLYKFHVFFSLVHYLNIKKIIKKDILIYSGKEKQFVPRSVIFQACLKNSVKALLVWGPHDEFSIRKYSHYSQRYFARNHINKHDFLKRISEKSFEEGKKYIENKFYKKQTDKSNSVDEILAFNKNLIKLNKNDFLNKLNLDRSKKTAVIFSHCSFDGLLETPRIMFNDFYHWLDETVSILLKNTKINVILKPHPREQQWGSLNLCEEIYKKRNLKDFKHIKLIGKEFHPSTLLEVADFSITARGTAGPEYAAFNVPCISVDYTPYNYCNFNYNFKNKNLYLKQLKDLPKLFVSDESKNKFDAYHYLNLSFNEIKSKNPYFAGSDISLPKNYSIIEESKYLNKCINLIKKSDFKEKDNFYNIYKNFLESNNYILFKK